MTGQRFYLTLRGNIALEPDKYESDQWNIMSISARSLLPRIGDTEDLVIELARSTSRSACVCREFSESPPDFSLLSQFPVNIRAIAKSKGFMFLHV